MKPLCSLLLFAFALGVCNAEEKPPLEREGDPLPIVKMPLAKIPLPKKLPEPPLLEKGHPTSTEVAVEGKIHVADKDFKPLFIYIKIREKTKNGWVIANSHVGGKPVKVKEGLYRYRSVIKTPSRTRTYYFEVYQGRDLISRSRVDVDEDLE